MVPPFDLDDVGIGGETCQRCRIRHDLDGRARGKDGIGKTPVARLFEKGEVAVDITAVTGDDLGMGLADPAAEMRRDVEYPHSAAMGAGMRVPPGARMDGSGLTICLNFSSSIGRWASILSGRQWVS